MSLKESLPKQARLPESAHIWDVSDHQFVTAYRADFKRQKAIILLNAITFNASVTSKTGVLFEVQAYKTALITIGLAIASTPTDILISIEFSPDRANWFKYVIGPFGDLRYEDAAGDKTEALDIPILAPYIRAKAVATGTDATKTFLLSVGAILNG